MLPTPQERTRQASGRTEGGSADTADHGTHSNGRVRAGVSQGAVGAAAKVATPAAKSALTRRLTSRKEQAKALLVGHGANTSCRGMPAC